MDIQFVGLMQVLLAPLIYRLVQQIVAPVGLEVLIIPT